MESHRYILSIILIFFFFFEAKLVSTTWIVKIFIILGVSLGYANFIRELFYKW